MSLVWSSAAKGTSAELTRLAHLAARLEHKETAPKQNDYQSTTALPPSILPTLSLLPAFRMAAFDPATTRELDTLLESYTKDPYSCLPRVVVAAASSRDGLVYSGRSGWAQVPSSPSAADGEPIAEDSIFELFSCTKLVATIAVMQLAEQGLLGLDDEAERWVAELGEAQVCTGFADDGKTPVFEGPRRKVTVGMLLTHTAG